MGCAFGLFKNCSTNYRKPTYINQVVAPAPNPNPKRWRLLKKVQFKNAYVLKVKYLDCANYEGEKVMVYLGKYTRKNELDPHFKVGRDSPIARFKPTQDGWVMAVKLAMNL